MSYTLQEAEIKFKDDFVMTICAPRESGKSFLIKALLRQSYISKFDYIIVMCPTVDFNDDFEEFEANDKFTMVSDVKESDIEELFARQASTKRACRTRKKSRRLQDGQKLPPMKCPKTLLILDDCIDSGVLQFRGVVDKIAERGRHIHLSLIVSSQRITAVSRSVRINSNYFIIFSCNVSEIERFLEDFILRQQRRNLRDLLTAVFQEPYQFLLIDMFERDNRHRVKISNADEFIQGKALTVLFNIE